MFWQKVFFCRFSFILSAFFNRGIFFLQIQVALRHKSEIEHHRNKIRLRAKRKGHYDFPTMDEQTGGIGDMKDQDRIYQKAQMQIDKILDPDGQMPSMFMESKKRYVCQIVGPVLHC